MNDEEFTAIIRAGAEDRHWDFKGPMAWDEKDKRACCSLVKDLLAFANTGGGSLIIGVDDKTRERLGVSDEQLLSFDDSRVGRFVNNYVAPPIDITVKRPHDTEERKKYVVLIAPAFPNTPHICKTDYKDILRRGDIYVRTANKETARVTDPEDVSSMIERSVRNRRDTLLRIMGVVLETGVVERGKPTDEQLFHAQISEAMGRFDQLVAQHGYVPSSPLLYIDVASYPSSFRLDRFDASRLRPAVEHAVPGFWRSRFPYVSHERQTTYAIAEGIETFAQSDVYEYIEFWQCRTSGLFVHRTRPWDDLLGAEKGHDCPVLYFVSTIGRIVDAVEFVGNLYDELGIGVDELVTLHFTLKGCNGRRLASDQPIVFRRDEISHEEQAPARRSLPVAEWKASRDRVSAEMAQEVFRLFNADVAVETLSNWVGRYVGGTL